MENLVKLYEGKSKIVYEGTEPGTCVISYKDTATAGNGVKKEDLPGKGKLNAASGRTLSVSSTTRPCWCGRRTS